MTEHFKLDPSSTNEAAITRTAEVLAGGGVVAVPTDTVYGLACRSGFPASVNRIFELKGRPSDKPLPWLLPDADSVFTFVNEIPRAARRLIRAFWPGPLTLVLGPAPQTVAVRLPDHDVLREILRRAGGPVAATSANPSGMPAAVTAEEVRSNFEGRIDVLVDGGPARIARESTIVRVGPDGACAVLREGHVSVSEVRRALAPSVLFVCTGNTCRSPMAEAILKSALATALGVPTADIPGLGFHIASAGLHAGDGAPASPGASDAARRAGLSLDEHRSRSVTPELLASSDFVFAMSQDHLIRLHRLFGADAGHAELLDPHGRDVLDPFGGSDAEYSVTFASIERSIRARLPKILESARDRSISGPS